nr:uncharacterized protein LOC109191246 [Ipomoea trifida]
MRVNKTYPTIVGRTAELAKKRIREENKSKAFVRGKVIPRIAKPAAVAVATSRQNVEAPISAEPTVNVPPSSVDRVAEVLQKLASTVAEFDEVMADIGKQGTPANVMRKTFSGISNMLNVASTMKAPSTPTASQLDDIFYVLCHGHYFLVCINIKASKVEIIDNKALITGVTKKDKYGDYTNLLVTSLREYQAVGSSELFWKEDGLTEEFCGRSTSLDKLSFADVMQFADFRPKLRLNEAKVSKEETGLDPIYFLKFPVLNEKVQGDEQFNDQELGKEGGGVKEDGAIATAAVQLKGYLLRNMEKKTIH